MATTQHSTLTGADLHEPKGADTAAASLVYVSDGAGSGSWVDATNAVGAGTVTQTMLAASAVGQTQLKVTSGTVSTTNTTNTQFTLAGGAYGFYPNIYHSNGTVTAWEAVTNTSASAQSKISIKSSTPAFNANARQHYIQASPPYNLGNGDIPLFIFADIDALGNVISTYVAEDPPWANNGKTNIRADFYLKGIPYQYRHPAGLDRANLRTTGTRAAYFAQLKAGKPVAVEVTQTMKQADMSDIPHPFLTPTGTIVLLNPIGSDTDALHELLKVGENVSDIVHKYLNVSNTPIKGISTPPGVVSHNFTWKNNVS